LCFNSVLCLYKWAAMVPHPGSLFLIWNAVLAWESHDGCPASQDTSALMQLQQNQEARAWTKLVGTPYLDDVRGLAYSQGALYLASRSEGDLFKIRNIGSSDSFFAKLTSGRGKVRWRAREPRTDAFDLPLDIAVSDCGGSAASVYAAGITNTRTTYFNGTGTVLPQKGLLPALNTSDGYVVKLDDKGRTLWQRTLITGDTDAMTAVASSGEHVFVGGATRSDLVAGEHKGGADCVLGKLDPKTGEFLWVQQFGTSGEEAIWDLAACTDGSAVAVGQSSGNLSGQVFGSDDAFVAKFNKLGNMIWMKSFGSEKSDVAYRVAADEDCETIYVGGQSDGQLKPNQSSPDIVGFVAKFDQHGEKQWLELLEGDNVVYVGAVSTDDMNNAYVGGYTYGNLTNLLNSGGSDGFIIKFTADGSRDWAKPVATDKDDEVLAVVVARGQVFAAGYTEGNLNGLINQGGPAAFPGDGFVLKLATRQRKKRYYRSRTSTLTEEAAEEKEEEEEIPTSYLQPEEEKEEAEIPVSYLEETSNRSESFLTHVKYCVNGVRSGSICCAKLCGTCGGSGCSLRNRGDVKCCLSANTRTCEDIYDVGCTIPSGGWCQGGGIKNGQTCCLSDCGSCGGSGCSGRPGGRTQCCIGETVRPCDGYTDQGCRIPDDWCNSGLRYNKDCCASSCGSCTGSGCSSRPGGSSKCCSSGISATCSSTSSTACKISNEYGSRCSLCSTNASSWRIVRAAAAAAHKVYRDNWEKSSVTGPESYGFSLKRRQRFNTQRDTVALYQSSTSECILAFSGTDDTPDWLTTNFQPGTSERCGKEMHAGFGSELASITGDSDFNDFQEDLQKCCCVFVTGHSLGGALAAIFHYCANADGRIGGRWLRMRAHGLITFGAPKPSKDILTNPGGACIPGFRFANFGRSGFNVLIADSVPALRFGEKHPKMTAVKIDRDWGGFNDDIQPAARMESSTCTSGVSWPFAANSVYLHEMRHYRQAVETLNPETMPERR